MSAMPEPDQLRAFTAARTFIQTQLTPSDLVALMVYRSGAVQILQDFTNDRDRLISIVETLVVGEDQNSGDTTDDAKAFIARKLKDPESARFSEVHVTSEAVCGSVNAKNLFGGYAGARRFYYVTATKLGFIERGGDISNDMLDQMAQGYDKFCR